MSRHFAAKTRASASPMIPSSGGVRRTLARTVLYRPRGLARRSWGCKGTARRCALAKCPITSAPKHEYTHHVSSNNAQHKPRARSPSSPPREVWCASSSRACGTSRRARVTGARSCTGSAASRGSVRANLFVFFRCTYCLVHIPGGRPTWYEHMCITGEM